MGKINDGGPAFPRPAGDYNGSRHGNSSQTGMSLRDYFAAKALQGLLAFPGMEYADAPPEVAARDAYAMADAMLAAREQQR